MWPFLTGFFQLACFQGSSMLYHLSVLYFFLLLNYNLLYRYTVFLSVYQLMDIELLTTFQLSETLLQTFVY